MLSRLAKKDRKGFLAEALRYVIASDNHERGKAKTLWSDGQNTVSVMVGDILSMAFNKKFNKGKKIIVVPVNDAFDFQIDDPDVYKPKVSVKTIHGKFVDRMWKRGISPMEIRKNVLKSLGGQGLAARERYPIGTIAVYSMDDDNDSFFFLLALSEFDENNRAHASKEDIVTAIDRLIDFYDKQGQGYPIYIPLLGTGMSRAGLTRIESYDLLKRALLSARGKIQGQINIVIYTKDQETTLKKEEE